MQDWFSHTWFTYDTLRSFDWANRFYLYGIAALPLLFLFRKLFNNRTTQRLNVAFLNKDVKSSWVSWLRHLPGIFMFLAITCLLVVLARPQRTSEETDRTSEGIDIMLALDISSSMLTQDIEPNRLGIAKEVAAAFIKGRFQDRIGLVVFSGEASSLCPLTTDYDLLTQFVDDISTNLIPTDGTAIGSALGRCITRLQEIKSNSKVVILLSDGANTAGNLDPVMAAQLAQAFGIKIYTIAIGTSTVAKTEAVDESTLRSIAQTGGGLFFRATDAGSLKNIFNKINTLEKVKIKSTRYRNVQDFFHIYLRWAIVFLLITLFLKNSFMGNVLED